MSAAIAKAFPVQRRPSSLVVLRSSFVTDLERADRHIRYICFRARELPTDRPGIFSADRDSVDVTKFIKSLDDPMTKDRKNFKPPKLHKLVFSMRGQDWERIGLSNWKPIIREAMSNVERQLGRRLEWVAAEHMSRSHPHCHVALKPVAYGPDGRGYRLRIDGKALKLFRGEVTRLVKRELNQVREQERQARRQLGQVRQVSRTAGDALALIQQIQRRRQLHEIERLREIQRQRAAEKGGRSR